MRRLAISGILFLVLSFFSCDDAHYDHDAYLEYALEFAGGNRSELERVLQHYGGEPEKLRAARFLIENMPVYYSVRGPLLDSLKERRRNFIATRAEFNRWLKQHDLQTELEKVFDARVITADYLISHIDHAFAVWESRPWKQYYTFDDFCEYVLPYRVGNEPLEAWQSVYYERYAPVLDSLFHGTDVVEAARLVADAMRSEGFVGNGEVLPRPNMGAFELLDDPAGTCRDACDKACYAFRALGIPVAIDFYQASPVRRSHHMWNALIDTTGRSVHFIFNENRIERGGGDIRKKGRVYRYCYGVQPPIIAGVYDEMNSVPSLFRNPFIRDVSRDYFDDNRVTIEASRKQVETPYLYLGVFNSRGWEPVAITKFANGKGVFRYVEEDVIYQPMSISEYGYHAIGYPFMLRDGKQHFFHPDTVTRRTVRLTRKYPMKSYIYRSLNYVLGTTIEGANRRDFSDAVRLYEIKDSIRTIYNDVYFPDPKPYRYWRWRASDRSPVSVAELYFYADSLGLDSLAFSVFGERPLSATATKRLPLIKDRVAVTYFRSDRNGDAIIIDFGHPRQVKRFTFMPQNDDNYVWAGDDYELFYYAGPDHWVSLGRRVADGSELRYENAPTNAIFWLRDYTKGNEEWIFYCQDGEQVFL